MLRIFLDEHGSGSDDLFVKIDGRPSRVWVVDMSWLGDFFSTNDLPINNDDELIAAKKSDVAHLIRFWEKLLLSDQSICYLPYYLHDQGGQAFQITRRKKLYHIVTVGSPDMIEGITHTRFLQKTTGWQQSNDGFEWELAPSSVQIGLTWSLARLEQPVIPLRYD